MNDQGVIFVSLRDRKNGSGMVRLADADADGRAEDIRYFGECRGTGIELNKDYLYFGTDTSIIRFKLNEKGFRLALLLL